MTTKKAIVTSVQIGHIEIEGLMLPDGSYRIAIPQLVKLSLVPSNRSLTQLKRLTGFDFQSHQKIYSELNSNKVNSISLEDLEALIVSLAKRGNQSAINLTIDLIGLSLQQLFSDAFGVKFEKEERQAWLKARQEGKATRRTLTDAIHDYLDKKVSPITVWYNERTS